MLWQAKLRNTEIDYARGEGNLYSDSSSDESSEDEVEEETGNNWGELDKDAERTEEATHRLAVCNMDWDRVDAEDIFLVKSIQYSAHILEITYIPPPKKVGHHLSYKEIWSREKKGKY